MSSELNPADYASRGCTANKLIDSPIWFDGLGFLSKAPEDWPNTLYQPPLTESAYAEFDLQKVKVMTTVVKASDEAASTDRQISHFSSLNKLLLATFLLCVSSNIYKAVQREATPPSAIIPYPQLSWSKPRSLW